VQPQLQLRLQKLRRQLTPRFLLHSPTSPLSNFYNRASFRLALCLLAISILIFQGILHLATGVAIVALRAPLLGPPRHGRHAATQASVLAVSCLTIDGLGLKTALTVRGGGSELASKRLLSTFHLRISPPAREDKKNCADFFGILSIGIQFNSFPPWNRMAAAYKTRRMPRTKVPVAQPRVKLSTASCSSVLKTGVCTKP